MLLTPEKKNNSKFTVNSRIRIDPIDNQNRFRGRQGKSSRSNLTQGSFPFRRTIRFQSILQEWMNSIRSVGGILVP